MEVPYVQVILTAASKHNEIDRNFRLDAINGFIKVGRASSRSACADSALDNNCYLKSPIVSRNHGRFIIGDKAHPLKLVDDGSTHGTFVNNVKLLPKQEFALENNSKVTFGNEIIHGKGIYITHDVQIGTETTAANYRPTIFRVSFIWHDPVIPNSFPAVWSSRPGIRAPTPESDSDDEENNADVNAQTPYARSPSIIVLDSPPCIDLTGDVVSDLGHRSVGQDALSTIANHDTESVESLWKSNNQDNDSIVKETNLPSTTNRRFYRFDYADSDPEDGLESTSQSSPPARDFDSLYDDDSEDSDVASSPQSHHMEEMDLEKDDMSDQEGEVDIEQDEEEKQSEDLQQVHDKDDDLEANFVSRTRDISDENHADLYANTNKGALTSYEQSLQWLGASGHDNAEAIVQLFEMKTNTDPDVQSIALECVQVIAEETPDEDMASKLEHWLDTGNLPEHEIEMESENAGPYGMSTSSERVTIELPSVPAMPPISRAIYTDQIHVSGCEPSLFTPSSFGGYPAQTSIFPGDHVGLRELPFTSGPTWHSCNSQPSPIMQISNLVDRVSAELLSTASSTLPARSAESDVFAEPHKEQPDHSSMALNPDMFDGSDQELLDAETMAFGRQKEVEVIREEPFLSLESALTGQKRKLDETDLEQQEDVLSEAPATSNVLTDSSSSVQDRLHEAQPSSLNSSHHNGSDDLQTLVQNTADEILMLGDTLTEEIVQSLNPERGQPKRQKRKTSAESHHRPSVLKTIATHCIAGAIGAIGLVAAIVATTPAQLKEELLYQKV